MKIKNGQIKFYKEYTIELVEKEKDRIFLFGDNLKKRGRKGQAVIRGYENTLGIPTKRYPCMKSKSCFFSDKVDEMLAVRNALLEVEKLLKRGKKIGIPKNGFGTGLSELKKRSPVIFKYITLFFKKYTNGKYLKDVTF